MTKAIDGAMTERIVFSVPLPPKSLRANARAHWAVKKEDADAYADVVAAYWRGARAGQLPPPWERARVTYTWKHAGVTPDHSNLGGNTKHLQDILCVAPKLSPQQAAKYRRWHLGIIENDSGIEAVFKSEKVAHKADECVEIEIVRLR